ncbi:MAG TPA: VOC family protein [Candidatus Eisenbacteria bacterium]|nr:VOC family protein [Candidatus Eisenbacteria bacterium]
MIERVDHLLIAARDLGEGVDWVESLIGVRAAPGGRHPAWGTHNALIGLGDRTYLEIIAPDPEAPAPAEPRPLGLDTLGAPRLASWVAAATDLERIAVTAKAQGVDLGEVMHRSRLRPDGSTLQWTMTDPAAPREGGIVPFFIDWGHTPHPAASAPPGGRLIGFRARHPDAARVAAILRGLDLGLDVERGDQPALIATLETPRGRVELV